MATKVGPSWAVDPSPTLVAKLSHAADAAYANAVSTLCDARSLFDAGRFPRACALAILAEEEFAKAVLLRSCASQPRWDSAVFRSLREHAVKQGIAQAARAYFGWLQRNLRLTEDLNRYAMIPVTPALFPGPKEWDHLLAEARVATTDPVRDRRKQDALYVRVARTGAVTSEPSSISEGDAASCIEDAEKVRVYAEAIRQTLSQADAERTLRAMGMGGVPNYLNAPAGSMPGWRE